MQINGDSQSPLPVLCSSLTKGEPHGTAGSDGVFHHSRERHCHTWLQRSDLAPGKSRGSSDAPPPAKGGPSTGHQKRSHDPKGKAAKHTGRVMPLQGEEGQGSALAADGWNQSPPQASSGNQEQPPPLRPPRGRSGRDITETRAHRLTVSCPSRPSTAALPHATFPPRVCRAGGWSSRGSRWLSPPLQASPSAAAGSYQLLAADGGTTAAARAAQTVDRQSACLPTERRSAPWAALAPGQRPGATQHPSHHFPPLQTHVHPSLPPLLSQKAARCHSPHPVGARTRHRGSPGEKAQQP